jgi:hypothetical protein
MDIPPALPRAPLLPAAVSGIAQDQGTGVSAAETLSAELGVFLCPIIEPSGRPIGQF